MPHPDTARKIARAMVDAAPWGLLIMLLSLVGLALFSLATGWHR